MPPRRPQPQETMPPERFLDDQAFRAFSDYIYRLTGISYGDNKRYLLDSRIRRRARHNGCATPQAYLDLLQDKGKSRDEVETLIDEISTHETSFFRHKDQMDIFAKLMGELMDDDALGPPRQLKVWSAACSSGEEPYTVSMILHDLLDGAQGWSAAIRATDISAPVVATARAGRRPAAVIAGR